MANMTKEEVAELLAKIKVKQAPLIGASIKENNMENEDIYGPATQYDEEANVYKVIKTTPPIGATTHPGEKVYAKKGVFKRTHQMAIFVDMAAFSAIANFAERTNRMIVGSLNLPSTMKCDVYGLADTVFRQFQTCAPIEVGYDEKVASDTPINEDAARELAQSLGYAGYMILRPASK